MTFDVSRFRFQDLSSLSSHRETPSGTFAVAAKGPDQPPRKHVACGAAKHRSYARGSFRKTIYKLNILSSEMLKYRDTQTPLINGA